MKAAVENVASHECYVVEVDGTIRSRYGVYIEALKAGMELKLKFPHSLIKVHDADETYALPDNQLIAPPLYLDNRR